MKKQYKTAHTSVLSSFGSIKSTDDVTTSYKLGRVTVLRSTRTGKDGSSVKVEVLSTHRRRLALETERQIRDLVASPITSEQRIRANQLAKKAKIAQESSVTAKFRRATA